MAELSFKAKLRSGSGKAYAAGLRREGKVPGVLYGQATQPQNLELEAKEMESLIAKTLGANALLTMNLEGGKNPQETVMFKDVQRDPVKSKLLHIDFYHVDMAHTLKLKIPVAVTGVAAGVKEGGGILQRARRFLNVRCLPSAIPKSIQVDVSAVDLDQSILLQDLPKVPGVEFLDDPHSVLVHVAAPEEEAAAAPVAEAGAAPAQPEVIGEKEREAKRAEKETGAPAAAPAAGGKAAPAPAAGGKAPAAAPAKPAGKK
jgi:large subunit ribosomal protein L25